jgi:cytochrome c
MTENSSRPSKARLADMTDVAATCWLLWRRCVAAAFVCCLALLPWPGLAEDLPDMLKGHGGPIKSISISPDGKQALTASFDYSIIHWDLSGAEARILHRLIGHDGAVNDAAFVPGGNRAVSVSDDGSLGIWDLSDGRLVTRINADAVKVLDVAVSGDGSRAAAARWDATARLYDLEKQTEIATLTGHKGNVNAVAFSADGRHLYSAAYDGQIIEWDVAAARQIRPIYRHGWGINSIALIDDNRLLFGALDGSVGVVGIAEADILTRLVSAERPIQSVKVSRDGRLMAYADGDGVIEVFETAGGKRTAGGPVTYGPVWDFAFVPGTNQIYHVGLDDFAMRWQVVPRELAPIESEFPRRFQLTESDDPGELEFNRKCSVCHTLTPDGKNRAGPTLYGIFGRTAGSLPGYEFSQALRESDIVWTEETIAKLFDHGPDVVVPGTKMPIQRLKSVERRDALIRFLKNATASIE